MSTAIRDRVEANIRLAWKAASKRRKDGFEAEELVGAATLGLFAAAERQMDARGKFSTYAQQWMRRKIADAISEELESVRFPWTVRYEVRRYHQTAARLKQEWGRTPTEDEIFAAIGTATGSQPRVRSALVVARLHADGENSAYLGDSSTHQSVVEEAERREEAEKIQRALARLEPRLAQILRMHYGLEDGSALGVIEIGHALRLSYQRIQQLLAKAIPLLREELAKEGLTS